MCESYLVNGKRVLEDFSAKYNIDAPRFMEPIVCQRYVSGQFPRRNVNLIVCLIREKWQSVMRGCMVVVVYVLYVSYRVSNAADSHVDFFMPKTIFLCAPGCMFQMRF